MSPKAIDSTVSRAMPKIFDFTGLRSGRPVVLRAKKKNDKSI